MPPTDPTEPADHTVPTVGPTTDPTVDPTVASLVVDPAVREVEVPDRAVAGLVPLIGPDRHAALREAAARTVGRLDGATVWNISSTATGGGVAEMLQDLVGYARDLGIDTRWLVLHGDPAFFTVTKRLHNRLHGVPGDDGDLGSAEHSVYAAVTAAAAAGALARVRPGDVVLLHDPQTVGLAPALASAGARVVWRCHIGREGGNRWTEEAWAFLRSHLAACERFVFTLRDYAPVWLDPAAVDVVLPSIDPFSPKNRDLPPGDAVRVLRHIGLLDAGGSGDGDRGPVPFVRRDGSPGALDGRATVHTMGPGPTADDRLVVQVSRWDRLKDMAGVMAGFAGSVAGRVDTHLVLAGPSVSDVSDDPEGAEVLAGCVADWEALAPTVRRHVTLATFPEDDIDANAVMVNALQRQATAIVQKSLAEGFGLTVTEGMWKQRAVVASRVGGITTQITPGTGVLLDDPGDLAAFGDVLAGLVTDQARLDSLGTAARRRVRERFLVDSHLLDLAGVLGRLPR